MNGLPQLDGPALFAAPSVRVTSRPNGEFLIESGIPLQTHRRCVGEYLEHWAAKAPSRAFLTQRDVSGAWQAVTYGQMRDQVYRIATWLLAQGLNSERPVTVLSDNSLEHAALMLACMHVGIPYSAISPAYSLVSKDFEKLRNLVSRIEPGLIYVGGAPRYASALQAIQGLHQAKIIIADDDVWSPSDDAPSRFSEMLADRDDQAVQRQFNRLEPDTLAKILFTSGSTGYPKGVINTHRMMCASQQAKVQVWPFLAEEPPVLIDWLPWNHTFGGNHNFNLILANGGTLYLDSGKPLPGLFDASIEALRDVSPTLYLNVPRAFDMLIPALRADAALRNQFFSRLKVIFYAAAALPQHLWDGLIELSVQELGYAVPMVTAWGSTETSPLATDCHFQADRSGVIGLPVPGVSLKLAPNGDKLEVRVKGPNVTPGYYRQPELKAQAFDEEGYYRIGDAVRFADETNPTAGLLFDGRVSEDFKLSTGTWVSVGLLRIRAIEALAPLAQDIVVTGHDRDSVGLLIFPNMAECRKQAGLAADAVVGDIVAHPSVRERVAAGLLALRRAGTGSSTFADRALLLDTPPSVDAGEITDKGYINQGAVLKERHAKVQQLYQQPPGHNVILLERTE